MLLLIAVGCLAATGEAIIEPITFYVARNGNDSWTGKQPAPDLAGTDGPFASIERGRDAVRELKAAGPLPGPVRVQVRAGLYVLRAPLRLDPRDSGTADCTVTYEPYAAEKVSISAGLPVCGWEPFRNGILQAPLPAGVTVAPPLRQLFFRGQRQRRARWPNFDPDNPLYGGWAFVRDVAAAGPEAKRGFRFEPPRPARAWAHPEYGEVFLFPWLCWQNDIVPMAAADPGAGTITLAREIQPGWNPVTAGNRFYVENLIEELDTPGEWCLNPDTRTLYFWPPAPGPLADTDVTIPVSASLIELRGTIEAAVEHVQIRGFVFTQTLALAMLRGYAVQSDGVALLLEHAAHCRIAGNRFDQVGGDAVRLENENRDNTIADNTIVAAGAHGICLYGSRGSRTSPHTWRDRTDELRDMARSKPVARGNRISGNYIHHCGVIEKHAAAIFVFNINAVENRFDHNRIHDVPRYGIALQIGLGGNSIEYNTITRSCLETADAAAIETNRWFVLDQDPLFGTGNSFRFNVVKGAVGCGAYDKPTQPLPPRQLPEDSRIWAPYYAWGLYFDNSPMDVTVYGNLVSDTVLGAVMILGAGRNVSFENNILLSGSRAQIHFASVAQGGDYGKAAGIRFVRNIVMYNDPEALLIQIEKPPLSGVFAEFDGNLYFQTQGAAPRVDLPGTRPEQSFEAWQKLGWDRHSVIGDPRFADPAAADGRLQPDSPAWKLGFQPLPTTEMGLGSDASALPDRGP